MDGIDRYSIVYKKDHGPSEDEVLARRNGDQWNSEKAKEYAQKVRVFLCQAISYFSNEIDHFRGSTPNASKKSMNRSRPKWSPIQIIRTNMFI